MRPTSGWKVGFMLPADAAKQRTAGNTGGNHGTSAGSAVSRAGSANATSAAAVDAANAGALRNQPGTFAHAIATKTALAADAAPDQSAAADAGAQADSAGGVARDTTTTYKFDFGPSSLDPGSMAAILAFLGGSPDHKSIAQQQEDYLNFYRKQYATSPAGPNNYSSATTDYLTGKA